MPKLEDNTTHFLIDGNPIPYNSCATVSVGDKVGLVLAGSNIYAAAAVPFSDWTDSGDTPYVSKAALLTAIGTITMS